MSGGPSPVRAMAPGRSGTPARLFCAIPLPEPARRQLVSHLENQLSSTGGGLPGRPVAPGNWHLTLRFLGDTPAPQREAFCQAMDEADLGPAFDLSLGTLGAFPRPSRAVVMWMGLTAGAAATQGLAAAVEAAAVAAGLPPSPRRYHPHLTLSRLRPPGDVRAIVETVAASGTSFKADRVVLFESHLARGGPRYEVVAVWRLA